MIADIEELGSFMPRRRGVIRSGLVSDRLPIALREP